MEKLSFIRSIGPNKWRVYSRDGKNLGTFHSRAAAEKRLAQIEMFKHMKNKRSSQWEKIYAQVSKGSISEEATFSGTMRELRQENPDQVEDFLRSFQSAFEEAVSEGLEDPEPIALMQARQDCNLQKKAAPLPTLPPAPPSDTSPLFTVKAIRKGDNLISPKDQYLYADFDQIDEVIVWIDEVLSRTVGSVIFMVTSPHYPIPVFFNPENTKDSSNIHFYNMVGHFKKKSEIEPRWFKLAQFAVQMGQPEAAGRSLAEIVKFLITRIPEEKRGVHLGKLRNKIWNLNELELAEKHSPPTASIGQSITFLKTVLQGHSPQYIRTVLTSLVQAL